MRAYIAICAQVIGGRDRPFEIVHGWDGERFANWQDAVRHGFKIRGSDDFNLGIIERGRLVEFRWMDQPMHESDRDELPTIAKQLGLRASPPHQQDAE